MRYPTLTLARSKELVDELVAGSDPAIDGVVTWRGDGESIDLEALDIALDEMQDRLDEIGADPTLVADKEPFEGELALAIHGFLEAVPVEVLDDPGFWRYLALSRFWWFIAWREAGPIAAGNAATYTDARRNTEQIPLRLYLRVKAVAAQNPELAKSLVKCTDFWRSHVIRVRTSTAPALAAAFAEMQHGKQRLATTPLRTYARRLNRTWTNVHLGLYDAHQAAELVEELRE
jgi:hypothetical protein